jgi:hypothetical protein
VAQTTQPVRVTGPQPIDLTGVLKKLPIIGLVILALVLIGLIIFLITRHLQGSPNRAMARFAGQSAAKTTTAGRSQAVSSPRSKANLPSPQPKIQPMAPARRSTPYEDRYKPQVVPSDGSPLMLKLFVEDQNTFIGKRNIHLVKSGFNFSIGGGKSDFLIFLVPVPQKIAELRYEGSHCNLLPCKSQYFPDIGAQPVNDCIGKTIRIISDKKYELRIRIELYEDPLVKLNALLHSVSVPG